MSPAPAIHDIDWRTSPLDLNLRGQNGERFAFRCPPGKAATGGVVGSGPYTDGSSICAAAVHAGVIHPGGGVLIIEVRPGQAHFVGSLSHFVQSESYEGFWSGSFLVLPGTDSLAPRANTLPRRSAGTAIIAPSDAGALCPANSRPARLYEPSAHRPFNPVPQPTERS